ncbi:MAG: excinuclease ABC subunit UvrC [Candidatus Aminicenantes bacterium]
MKEPLKTKIENLPEKSGIYFFKDRQKNVIYIGKARSLKNRVKSYFQAASDSKVQNILAETADLEFVLTGSEKEAAFLENNFIQQYQPKFNLRLKDDKSFPYLKLSIHEKFPGVYLTRRVEEDGAKYFGPFSPAHQARKTIHLLNKHFGLRGCEEAVPGRRQRPCLEYDLKLCTAPCVEHISEKEYRENVDNALLFLEGKVDKLLKIVKNKMQRAASRQEFEQAAHWRDLIRTIEHIKEKPKLISVSLENKDIFGFSRRKEKAILYVFRMKKGKVMESEGIYVHEKKKVSHSQILSSNLLSYYRDRNDIPAAILLPFEPSGRKQASEKLSSLRKAKVKIEVPRKGKNKKLVELANKNAEILLGQRTQRISSLPEAKEILGLKTVPHRIEGFDISNLGGKESVGSLVVFQNGLPQKKDYRKYKIKTVRGPDDVASLKEVISRRYTRLLEEKKTLPDLIFVDGGKGQLNAAQKTLESLGLKDLSVASLAKREEIIFTPSHKQGLKLDRTSPVLKLFQNVRNEAHHFALSFHRLRRTKTSFRSPLDGIPGLGKKKKESLLARYKGIERIKKAPLDELAKVIGKKAAHELSLRLKRKE